MSLKEDAYNVVKKKILTCAYQPNALLNEEILGKELTMSRTPVRDALSRLEQERLVKILPKKGFIVTGISLSEVDKVYEIRKLLEPYALRTYGSQIEYIIFEKLAEMFTRDTARVNTETIFQEDDDFHKFIIEATGNPYIIQAYQYPHAQNIRMRVLSGQHVEKRLERSQQEHLAVVDACLRRDWDLAAEAMMKHLDTAQRTFYEIMKFNDTQP